MRLFAAVAASGWVLTAALVASSCQVGFEDFTTRGCDPDHPCSAGQTCTNSRCGPPPPVNPIPVDAGFWKQGVHGFDQLYSCPGCSVTVEADDRNRLRAAAAGGTPFDRAFASTRTALVPGAQGRLRGAIRFPVSVAMRGMADLVTLRSAGGGSFLTLSFGPDNLLELQSDEGLLSADQLLNGLGPPTFETSPLFVGGVENLVDLAWKRGEYVELYLNDRLFFQRGLREDGTLNATPAELRLGVSYYSAPPDGGFAVELSEWRIGDQANVIP